jgi:hypothetical protein
MKFNGKTFENENIHMDFNDFVDCKFIDCSLVYHGCGPISLQGCTFTKVRWTFSGAAANTINFMAGLYTGAGEGGRALVEGTFDNIRKGIPIRGTA